MKQASAQTAQNVDAKTTLDLTNEFGTRFATLYKALTAFASMNSGIPASDPSVTALLASIANANDKLKPAYNGGSGIPVTGSTDEEKFHSLNAWLATSWRTRPAMSRKPDDTLDKAALDELKLRIQMALLRPAAIAAANDLQGNLAGVPVPIPSPTVTAPPIAAPPPKAAVVPSPTLTDAQRTEYEDMYARLYIITRGGAIANRTKAEDLRTQLRKVLDKQTLSPKDLADAEKKAAAPARAMLAKYYDAALKKLVESAPATAGVSDADAMAYQPEIKALFDSLSKLKDDTSKPQSTRDMAATLMGKLLDVWFLGEREKRIVEGTGDQRKVVQEGSGPRWDLAALHRKAAEALLAGNEKDARDYLTTGNDFFGRWQHYMADVMGADALATSDAFFKLRIADGPNHLPTSAELSKAKVLKRSAVTKDRPKSVDNGSESIEREAKVKYDRFKKYFDANKYAAGTTTGALSFQFVSDYYQSITDYSSAVSRLQDLNAYFMAHLPTDPKARSRTLSKYMEFYSKGALTFVDPTYNPFSLYTPPERRILVRQMAVGNPNITEAEVAAQLSRIPRWRYDEALYGVFKITVQVAPPAPTSLKSAVESWANFRAARYYMDHEPVEMRDYRNDDRRLEFAQNAVQHAIDLAKSSGLPSTVTQPLIKIATDWLTVRAKPSDAEKKVVAAALADLAYDIFAICEEELIYNTPGLRAPDAGPGSAADKKARAVIDGAEAEFRRAYSEPHVLPTLYPALARQISDHAIESLLSPAISITEPHARFNMWQEYDGTLGTYYMLLRYLPTTIQAPDSWTPDQAKAKAKSIASDLDRLKKKAPGVARAITALRAGNLDDGLSELYRYSDVSDAMDAIKKVGLLPVSDTLKPDEIAAKARELAAELDKLPSDKKDRYADLIAILNKGQLENGLAELYKICDLANITPILNKAGIKTSKNFMEEADDWDARKKDRDSALAAAAAIEVRHLSMLLSQPSFTAFPLDSVLSQTPGRLDVRSIIDARVSSASTDKFVDPTSKKRITLDIADNHMGKIPRLNGSLRPLPHEASEFILLGPLYMEFERQTMISKDVEAPPLLKNLDNAPDSLVVRPDPRFKAQDQALKTRMHDIATGLGFKTDKPFLTQLKEKAYDVMSDPNLTPQQQLRAMNTLFLGLLDARIAELETRLSGARTLDGFLIADLGKIDLQKSDDPNRFNVRYVTRAQDALSALQTLRKGYVAGSGNLFTGQLDPKEAVMIAENAIESVSEDNLSKIPTPLSIPVNARFAIAGTSTAVTISRDEASSRGRVRITAKEIMIETPQGSQSLESFEKANGRQRFTFPMLVYQDTGTTYSRTGEKIYMLLDPTPSKMLGLTQEAIGQVMRLPDGTEAVVKVKPTGASPSVERPWEVVYEGGKPVVLFKVQPGSLAPFPGDPAFNALIPNVASFIDRDRPFIEATDRTGLIPVVIPAGTPQLKK